MVQEVRDPLGPLDDDFAALWGEQDIHDFALAKVGEALHLLLGGGNGLISAP